MVEPINLWLVAVVFLVAIVFMQASRIRRLKADLWRYERAELRQHGDWCELCERYGTFEDQERFEFVTVQYEMAVNELERRS